MPQKNVRLHAELPSCKQTFLGHPVGAHKGCQTLKIGKIELLNTMVHRDMQLAYELAFIREVRWVDVSKVWIGE